MKLILRSMRDEFPAEAVRHHFYELFDDPKHVKHIVDDPFELVADARRNFMVQEFGVEIELDKVSVNNAARLLEEFFSSSKRRQGAEYYVKDFYSRPWRIDRDGSVPDGFEIASPPLRIGDIHLLRSLLKQLDMLGSKTGPKTGIHIHIGTQNWTHSQLLSLLFMYGNFSAEIALALKINESRREYCKPIWGFAERMRNRKRTYKELESAWFTHEDENGHEELITDGNDPRRRETRYREMNFLRYFDRSIHSKEKTIEFRGFNSTSDGKMLQAYILFLLAGVSFSKALPMPPLLDKDLTKVNKARFFRYLKTLLKCYLLVEDDLYKLTKDTFNRNFKQKAT